MLPAQDSLFLIEPETAVWIGPDQMADLQALLERSADFFELVEGQPPGKYAAQEVAAGGPPGWTLDKKFLIGIYGQAGAMIATIEGIRDYPETGTFWIGLMIIDPDHRGQGLGERMLRGFEGWALAQGAAWVGLGVAESNLKAYRFWQRMGFEQTSVTGPVQMGHREQKIFRMKKRIALEDGDS
jgi:GNAT superfamily N-acetyltransferase